MKKIILLVIAFVMALGISLSSLGIQKASAGYYGGDNHYQSYYGGYDDGYGHRHHRHHREKDNNNILPWIVGGVVLLGLCK